MEVTDNNLQTLASYLQNTLHHDAAQRKAGKQMIAAIMQATFGICSCTISSILIGTQFLLNTCFLLAERFLESIEGNQNYPVLLLHLMGKTDVDTHIRVSAAITFKNYIKRNWRVVSKNR